MASVFPDTSVNNPDTGFAWADGDIWNDPDSGLTYSWYTPVWKTGGAGADGNFVQVDGDNMTGDLTLGTDKITLDATAGSASFASDVKIGGTTSAPNIALNANGSSVFADDVQSGGDANGGVADGVRLRSRGLVQASATIAANTVWTGYQTGTTGATSSIFADGSATFAGLVDVNGIESTYLQVTSPSISASAWLIQATSGNGTVHQVFADGSAEFAGNVNLTGDDGTLNTSFISLDAPNAFLQPNHNVIFSKREAGNWGSVGAKFGGIIARTGNDTAASIDVVRGDVSHGNSSDIVFNTHGGGAGSPTEMARFKYDGSATFASSVESGFHGITLNNEGSGASNEALAVDSAPGNGSYTRKITFKTDGSANFAGNIQSGELNEAANQGGVFIQHTGLVRSMQPTAAAGNTLVYQGQNGNTTTFQVDKSGNATFSGTVTATVVPPSDARFKENIEPAKPQLADVVALGGLLKNYDWNDQAPLNEEIRSQRQLGLIAQEAETVCPAIVKDIKRTKTVEVTPAVKGPKGAVIKEAVTKEEDDSYKGISQDALIMKLIGAVTELSAEVEALKAAK